MSGIDHGVFDIFIVEDLLDGELSFLFEDVRYFPYLAIKPKSGLDTRVWLAKRGYILKAENIMS